MKILDTVFIKSAQFCSILINLFNSIACVLSNIKCYNFY